VPLVGGTVPKASSRANSPSWIPDVQDSSVHMGHRSRLNVLLTLRTPNLLRRAFLVAPAPSWTRSRLNMPLQDAMPDPAVRCADTPRPVATRGAEVHRVGGSGTDRRQRPELGVHRCQGPRLIKKSGSGDTQRLEILLRRAWAEACRDNDILGQVHPCSAMAGGTTSPRSRVLVVSCLRLPVREGRAPYSLMPLRLRVRIRGSIYPAWQNLFNWRARSGFGWRPLITLPLWGVDGPPNSRPSARGYIVLRVALGWPRGRYGPLPETG